MDWLRIAAFGLLIFYHSALYFGPHSWLIRAQHTYDWLVYPLNAVAPWRLLVLFAVSGFATAAMIRKIGNLNAFFRERSARLLVPLLFGMLVLVPPQAWIRHSIDNGYDGGFLTFWRTDYFRFGELAGHGLPHWEHLWFLSYLWAYTGLLILFLHFVRQWPAILTGVVNRLIPRLRLLWMPIILLVTLRLMLTRVHLTNIGMIDDWIGHEHYLPAYLFGFAFAHNGELREATRRLRFLALGTAIAAYAVIDGTLLVFGTLAAMPTTILALENIADSVMAWSMTVALLGFAETLFNRDHRWRIPLSRAVFPAYLVHQTVIILVGYWLLPLQLNGVLAYIIIVTAVITASWVIYFIAARSRWVGLVFGMPMKTQAIQSTPATAS